MPRKIIDADKAIGKIDLNYDMEIAVYETIMRSSHKLNAYFASCCAGKFSIEENIYENKEFYTRLPRK
jgi:hypothetical protein